MTGIYYYKLVSPYTDDVTKNCKLTVNEIDGNFFNLKSADISAATFVSEDKSLVLTRNNGEKLIVILDDVTYNLDVKKTSGESGTTLSFAFDGKNGKENVVIPNILTADNLMDVIGSDILTKVITDGTLRGHGTMDTPLGINGVEKTGSLAPVLEVFDLTEGGRLPEVAKLGTRYITKEYVNDYGYLYNGNGVKKIQEKLDEAYIGKNTKDNKKYAWRVPSKNDWDVLLNSLEPCNYQNHGSAKCHVELGKLAGKYLKSECGWVNQPDCECVPTKPNTGCTYPDVDIDDQLIPHYDQESPIGVDKYGMTILPSGFGALDTFGRPGTYSFKEQSMFWSTTHVNSDLDQDVYAKIFDWNKGGVTQVAECPKPYYSVRLVKKYDGSNYRETEYIDGVLYRCILFPESGQIWLASNFADKNGFLTIDNYEAAGATAPEVLDPNNGYLPNEMRIEMFINEWNGRYWEKKVMDEGVTIVIQNPCFDTASGDTMEFCWVDGDGYERCIEVEIPKVAQSNIEYRVYLSEDGCDKVLKNTDDLVVERVLSIVVPMIDEERWEREKADVVLSGAIDTLREDLDNEIAERISADTIIMETLEAEIEERKAADEDLQRQINEEVSARTEADADLQRQIDEEISARTEADADLQRQIDEEVARATQREDEIEEALIEEIERATAREDEIDGQLIDWEQNPFTIKAATSEEYNMVLPSKDGIDEHSIKIKFDGNFGEI